MIVFGVALVALLGLIVWLKVEGPTVKENNTSPVATPPQIEKRTRLSPSTRSTNEAVTETNSPPVLKAADLYRKAFALLDALSDEEKGLLRDWRTNAVAPELCAKLKPIAELAHQAGTNCDWGVRLAGFETKLPHLEQARQLARALVWDAAHCRKDDAVGVGENLLAMLRVGQNSSGFVIGHLVNSAIQRTALEFLAENARSLPAAARAELLAALSNSSYDEAFYQAMEQEAKGLECEANRIANGTNSVEDLRKIFGDPSFANLSKEQFVAGMREVATLEREYVAAIALPEAEYQAWLTKRAAAQQTNPLIGILMPVFDRVVEQARAAVVQRAMAVAGLQVLTAGPSVLTQYLDPASGQPFQYQPSATGFQLTSSFQINGKPVSLNFRQ